MVALKNRTMMAALATASALELYRARMTSMTVTPPILREMSAIFLPRMPYSKNSAVTWTVAMYTQPKPVSHA